MTEPTPDLLRVLRHAVPAAARRPYAEMLRAKLERYAAGGVAGEHGVDGRAAWVSCG